MIYLLSEVFNMKIVKNTFNKIKNEIIKKLKAIKKDHLIKQYIKNNVLFLSFVILMVINATLLRFLCMHSIDD